MANRAGCPDGFRASNPPSFDLVAKMRASGPFKALLAEPRPSRPTAAPTVFAERSNLGPAPPTRPTFQAPQPLPPPPKPAAPVDAAAPSRGDSKWNNKIARGSEDANVGQARWTRQGQDHEIYILDDDEEVENGMRSRRGGPAVLAAHPSSGPIHLHSTSGEEEEGAMQHGAFQAASAKYVSDLRKEGKNTRVPAASSGAGAGASRVNAPGLRRGNGAPIVPGGGVPGGKFVPPFVKKALQAQQGGGSNNNGNNAAGGGNNGATVDDDGPLSARTLELLRLSPGDPLPEELAKLDANLIEQVCNEVIDSGGEVTWEDIAGQDAAKKLIQEVVVWPMLNPHIFRGARAPPKGILLFGPPGTGKTLLGKAIASNIKASFFSISASSLTSKWIGEGEKMVRVLFAVAGWLAPAVIFIDEIDSLLSARKSEGEHEASRRLKTEMLIQMEGCDPASSSRRVLLIGATNRPEELDEAARRRMPKQLYIPLPCGVARRQMVERQLGPGGAVAATLSESDLDKIVSKTDGYSGSDMKNLIQEACQGPVRDAVRAAGAGVAALSESDLRAVVLRDFAVAARAQRASVEPGEVVRYEQYNEKHGAKVLGDGTGGGTGDGGDEDLDDDW